jgi:hypothetical protein
MPVPHGAASLTSNAVSQQLLDLFPLNDLPPQKPLERSETVSNEMRIKRINESLIWQDPIPRGDEEDEETSINRPGSFYRHYRTIDDLPDNAKVFYSKAGKFFVLTFQPDILCYVADCHRAENAGLTLEMLVRAVYKIERQLFNWVMEERRKRFAAEQGHFTDAMDGDG